MSEDNTTQPTELDELKARADQMGITYRKDITLETLRKKVNDAVQGPKDTKDSGETPTQEDQPSKADTQKAAGLTKRQEATQLVRIRLTCMNPNKREWDGEMFIAGNRVVGTHKRFVPFDVEWHVPRVILNMIEDRKCQVFVSERDEKGRSVRKGKLIKEFSVEKLPALTKEELEDLARRQAMANGTAAA